MNNRTAIFLSAAMVLSTAAVSGAVYVSASQATPPASQSVSESVPAAEVIVEYVDTEGNIIPVETTVTPAAEEEPTAGYGDQDYEAQNYEEQQDHDEYEGDGEHDAEEHEEEDYEDGEHEDEEHEADH